MSSLWFAVRKLAPVTPAGVGLFPVEGAARIKAAGLDFIFVTPMRPSARSAKACTVIWPCAGLPRITTIAELVEQNKRHFYALCV
jgi:hypothetical protein